MWACAAMIRSPIAEVVLPVHSMSPLSWQQEAVLVLLLGVVSCAVSGTEGRGSHLSDDSLVDSSSGQIHRGPRLIAPAYPYRY